MVTTCREIQASIREIDSCLGDVGKLTKSDGSAREKCFRRKMFIANFAFWANEVFGSIIHLYL